MMNEKTKVASAVRSWRKTP